MTCHHRRYARAAAVALSGLSSLWLAGLLLGTAMVYKYTEFLHHKHILAAWAAIIVVGGPLGFLSINNCTDASR